jgi:hypothetical protein
MANGRPLFAGSSEADQLDRIFRTLGTPIEAAYPGLLELPGWSNIRVRRPVLYYSAAYKVFVCISAVRVHRHVGRIWSDSCPSYGEHLVH